jgi:hypothetical protein
LFEAIEECSIEILNERERYWQEYYDVLSKKGLNCILTKTNDRSGKVSKESIEKNRISQKKKYENGYVNPNKGKKLSHDPNYVPSFLGKKHKEESNIKNRESHLGKKISEETRLKMSEMRRGKKKSEEHKANIGKANLGKTHSEELKTLLSEKAIERYKNIEKHPSNKKVINIITLDVFPSLKNVSIVDNTYKYNYLKCMLNGSNKNKSNYMYLEDYNKLNNK